MRLACHATVAVVLGLAVATGPVFAADPVKIGLVLPFSAGPFVPLTNEIANAFQMAIDDAGGKAGGRQIVVLHEDTTHKPDVAQAKAKKLVFEDKVDILVGPVGSNELMALEAFANQSKTPLIIPNAGDNEATGERCSAWVIRTSFSNDQLVREMGPWMVKHGYKKVALIAFDFAGGHQLIDGFAKPFKDAGGKVVSEQYPPLGPIGDFGPYLTKINAANPDAVFAFFAGPPATALVKQFSEFGLKQSIRLTGVGVLISPLNLPSEGEAADGVIGILHYIPEIENPVNKAFQQKFQAKYNRAASEFAAQGYDTGKLIIAAINSLGGKTIDKVALVEALHSVRIEGTRGPLRIDPKTNNVVQDIYIYEAKRISGKISFSVLERIKAVQDPPNGCKL